MFVIPFSLLPPPLLRRFSNLFMKYGDAMSKIFPYLQLELDRAGFIVQSRKYISQCMTASSFMLIFLSVAFSLFFAKVSEFYFGIILAVVVSALIFFMQLNYPKIASSRRIRKLDSDLLASLQAIMIQLNSGISLFESLVILSNQEFGEISIEFKKVVKKINAGVPQIKALEDAALQNPSPYFRRALWQIINGMKEGATINKVIATTISNLNKEQIIQIEKYGGQLNPLAMFYMMGAVIVPTLSITFFVVLASFIGLSDVIIKASFLGLLCFVIFFQFMFSGIIKTKRPSLLGE